MVYTQEGVMKDSRPWGKMLAAGATAVTLSVAMFTSAFAATTTVTPTDIKSSDMGGWYKYSDVLNEGTATIVNTTNGDMLRFDTPTQDSYVRVRNNSLNVNLNDLSALTYQTKQVSAPSGSEQTASVALRLFVDYDGESGYDDVLVYEPYYQNATQVIDNSLQTWDAASGKWWSNNSTTYNGSMVPLQYAGGYDSNFTLDDVVADYENARIVGISLGNGTYNYPWIVDADNLTVNDTVYDFELPEAKPQVLSAQDCKNGGYNNVATKEGKDFKNQGACVSYVQANEKASFKRNGQ